MAASIWGRLWGTCIFGSFIRGAPRWWIGARARGSLAVDDLGDQRADSGIGLELRDQRFDLGAEGRGIGRVEGHALGLGLGHGVKDALRTLDLSFGMDNTQLGSGAVHTDYSFKFSKRFLNNRLRISMGGRVSTGASAADDNGAYFDNFSLEYRLNQKETQYLKLYYEREAYDWLEGNISVFGGGFSWRRKLRHFKDIFKLKSDDDAVIPVIRTDSTQRKLP